MRQDDLDLETEERKVLNKRFKCLEILDKENGIP